MNTSEFSEPSTRFGSEAPRTDSEAALRSRWAFDYRKPSVQIVEMTCSHCGATRRFARQRLRPVEVADFECRSCRTCGGRGVVIVIVSYMSYLRSQMSPVPNRDC